MAESNPLESAKIQIKQLLEEKKELNARMKEINVQLDRAERFIADWDWFAAKKSGEADSGGDKNVTKPNKEETAQKPKRATGNSKKEDVAEGSREIIAEAGAPVSRADLLEALLKKGLVIEGTDPAQVLSTMLWRTRDRVMRLKSGGYWLPEKPWAEAGYDPDPKPSGQEKSGEKAKGLF